ncbi:MAG: hypothetical protein A2269_03955 [Lentisphaerae bacterium RIFOXYA12_FULL_60_10]|nr:MAG: hypothetical protein A2269_03955 [Lentisphaerae bacterium RIFOXYA12_FULL_60_10]
MTTRQYEGKVITVCGPVDPAKLGQVLMHEHLHSDMCEEDPSNYGLPPAPKPTKENPYPLPFRTEEKPMSPARLQYLLDDAVPLLKQARTEHGMNAYCDVTMPPWRAWPDVYPKISKASGVQIIMATGFYREIEMGRYWAKTPDLQIWPFVRKSSVEELADFCVREILEGVHGTNVHAGCIKLGTSQPAMTPTERKTFQAGARAWKQTGVHITTHCTLLGADTSQLTILDMEGVDLRRVVIGHVGWHLSDPSYRKSILSWMDRGANFMPTNLDVRKPENWRLLIEAIHQVFDAGHGDKLLFGMDHGYCTETGLFERVQFMPQPPWMYMFKDVLPVFRSLGLTAAEEKTIMVDNPRRILPVQST